MGCAQSSVGVRGRAGWKPEERARARDGEFLERVKYHQAQLAPQQDYCGDQMRSKYTPVDFKLVKLTLTVKAASLVSHRTPYLTLS